mgnify:FL=1
MSELNGITIPEVNLSNGAPYEAPPEPQLVNNNDAYYASILSESENPVDTYLNILKEAQQKGQSSFIESLQFKFQQEDNKENQDLINNILLDPEMERSSKRQYLENYLYKNKFEPTLRDRYKQKLSNEYLMETGKDLNDETLIAQDNKEYDLDVAAAWDQSYQNMVEEQKNPKPSSKSFDQQVEQLNKYDGNTIVDAVISEPLAISDMIFGQGFKWIVDILDSFGAYFGQQSYNPNSIQTPVAKAGSLIINYMKEGTGSLDPKKVAAARKILEADETEYGKALSTLTSLYDYTTKRNSGEYDPNDKTLSASWAQFYKEFLNEVFGVDDENLNNTISIKLLSSLAETTQAVGEYVNPNDPALVSLPLDILIGILGPKGIKSGYKGTVNLKNKVVVGKPGAALIKQLDNTKLDTTNIPQVVTSISIPASREVQIRANTPLATTMVTNPKKGINLIEAGLEDPTMQVFDTILNNTGEQTIGWSPRTVIQYFSDANGNIFNLNNPGWLVDSAALRELKLISEMNATKRFMPEGARDIPQRLVELETISSGLNGINPRVPLVPAKSFSVFEPVPLGFETRLIFRKSSTSDYVTLNDAVVSATELKRSLVEEAGVDAKLANKEVTIIELDSNLNEVRRIDGAEVAKLDRDNYLRNFDDVPQEMRPTSTYRIEWKRDKDLYDAFFGSMKETPKDRYTGLKGVLLRTLFNKTSSSTTKGIVSDIFTPYGKFAQKMEDAFFSQDLAKESFFNNTLTRLNQIYKKEMTTKEQNQFSDLLIYMSRNQKDMLSGGDIGRVLGEANLRYDQVQKFQTAVQSFRIVTNELHQMRQQVARRVLQDEGYNSSFYYIDPITKERMPMPVKDTFTFRPADDFINFVPDNAQRIVANYEVWDFNSNKPILHKSNNLNKEATHYVQDGTGMPQQQIHQLSKKFLAPDGNYYNFGVFGTVKAGPLPRDLSPQVKGYVPKIHNEGIVVRQYPVRFKQNGRQIDYSNDRAKAIRDLSEFSETIAMFQSRKDAIAYMNTLDNANYFYEVDLVSELKRRNNKDLGEMADMEIQRHQLKTNESLRNGLKYELESDPYSTLVQTAQTTGAAVMDIVGTGQLKAEFVNAFMNNNPYIKIAPKDNVSQKGLGRIEDRFPSRDQIQEVAGHSDVYNHALAIWDKIYIYEMGKARGDIAGIVGWLGGTLAEIADATAGQTKAGKYFIGKGRYAQRHPGSVAGAPLRPITSLWIIMRPVKQFILQSLASLGPIAVVSNGNPIQMARLYTHALTITSKRISLQRNMKKGTSDLNKHIDSYWDLSEKAIKDSGLGIDVTTGKFTKYTNEEYALIINAMEKSGLNNVRDHVYNQGIGINTLPKLGATSGTNLTGLRGVNTASYLNPLMYLEKTAQKAGEIGFEFGETINRDLFMMVALEQFKQMNPKRSWKTPEALSQIALDANRLAGGMNNSMAFGWQSNLPLRYLGLFTSFSQKMSERTWNAQATPFTGKQRAALLAADFAIYGSSLYNVDKYLRSYLMEHEDPDMRTWGEYFGKLNLSYQIANAYGKYLGKETFVVPGEVLSVHGNSPLGPISNFLRMLASAKGDTIDTKEMGASVAFYKKIFGDNGAIRLLFDVYSNNSDAFSSAEKMRMTKAVITDMIPFLSAAEKLIFGALTDEWTADITKTGADTGLETTSGEQIWKALLSAPDSRTTMLWDQTGKNIDKKADIRAEAKRAVQIYRKSRGNKPMEVDEVKEFLVVWKFKLNKGTLVTNTLEHNEFMDQALTMIAQQDVSFAEKFYREFKKDFKYDAPYYSDSTIEQIRTLKATLSRKFPDSIEELNEMEAWMLDANDAYKQGN